MEEGFRCSVCGVTLRTKNCKLNNTTSHIKVVNHTVSDKYFWDTAVSGNP